MLVRIRFGKGSKVERKRRKNQRVAMAFATFLTPAGLFSHWQVWFAFAGLLQTGSHLLNRYGRAEGNGARS